jgi:hypothetical protein
MFLVFCKPKITKKQFGKFDPADAAVAATRCERAALRAVQEQVRRAAWAAAGLR